MKTKFVKYYGYFLIIYLIIYFTTSYSVSWIHGEVLMWNIEYLIGDIYEFLTLILICIFGLSLAIKTIFPLIFNKYFYQLILSIHLLAITVIYCTHIYVINEEKDSNEESNGIRETNYERKTRELDEEKEANFKVTGIRETNQEKHVRESLEKEFWLTETENIDKIIMNDKGGNIIKLEKEGNKWIINNKYPVSDRQIEYTLNVMKDIKIKSSVSEQKTEFVLQNIATKGVKVEIFDGEQKIKSYYIGGNTPDHHGTYMIMENSENPYVMHIPDRHPGILNPKYGIKGIYINENVWREPITINIDAIEITEVKVIDFINKDQSYTINIEDKKLTDSKNNEILIDNRKYNSFASFFSNLRCGVYKPDLNPEDFILSKKIYITNNSQTDSLIIYDKTKIQKTQKEFSSNVEYLYAKWNNSDMVIIQKNIFNKVLITLDEIKGQNFIKTSSM